MGFQVAIDGPSGSGKSSISKAVAKELGLIHIDTGAMYRAVGLYILDANIGLNDNNAISNALEKIKIDIKFENNMQRIYLNYKDVTDLIRTQAVADASSRVATIESVRKTLVLMQQKLAQDDDVIMDGRDIGTHVLKNADLKIYIDASVDARTTRRCNELENLSQKFNYEQIKKEIQARDFNDMNREFSPLKKANDAIYIDTSDLSFDEVKSIIIDMIIKKQRGN